MRRVYLDNNATTPVLPQVVRAMEPWWTERFGNASAVHTHGRTAREAVDHAREQVAALLGARPSEITFTGSGTEADNQSLFGTLAPGDHLITSSIEHHAVLHAAQELERRGVELTVVDPDSSGVISVDSIRSALRPTTALVSLMLANNETGVLQPVREVAAMLGSVANTSLAEGAGQTQAAAGRRVLLHTDAVQCGGKLPISVADLGCDLLSLSAHKMHAPQGIGALWVRRGVPLRPLLFGGPHERQRRAGTENVPGIVAFGEAATLAAQWLACKEQTSDENDPSPTFAALSVAKVVVSAQTSVPHSSRALSAKGGVDGLNPAETPNTQPTEAWNESQDEPSPTFAALSAAKVDAPAQLPGSSSPKALARLHQTFEHDLLRRIPGATIHGAGVPRLPNTTSIRFSGVDAEALVIALDLQGISLSGGSACTSGAVEPSHVLRAMGLTDTEARSTIRISLSRLTTAEDLAQALDTLDRTVHRLRNLP